MMVVKSHTTQITAATLINITIEFTAAEITALRALIPRLPVGDLAIPILQELPDATATAVGVGATTTMQVLT